MPRRFTGDEELRIREALRSAARSIIGPRGVRKTTIEELAHAAGISKGSFYRFYSGKEELALEMLAIWERSFHRQIEQRFHAAQPAGSTEAAVVLKAVFVEDFPRQMKLSGMQGLFDAAEIDYLRQRASAEHIQQMDEQDLRLFERLAPLFAEAGLIAAADDRVIIAALRLLFDSSMAVLRHPSGGPLQAEHYHEAIARLIEGLFLVMFRAEQAGRKDREKK
jgi:AcrR family transcriptional regulator